MDHYQKMIVMTDYFDYFITLAQSCKCTSCSNSACHKADIRVCFHHVHYDLVMTSLLQVVNRLDASSLSRCFIHKLDTASCFNNLQQVCKYQVASSMISTDLCNSMKLTGLMQCAWIKLMNSKTCVKSVASLAGFNNHEVKLYMFKTDVLLRDVKELQCFAGKIFEFCPLVTFYCYIVT